MDAKEQYIKQLCCNLDEQATEIIALKKQLKLMNSIDIESVCEMVHKAYCEERIRQGREPYWTGGDYSKLDEATKDYDRVTVRAVLKAITLAGWSK